MYLSPQGQARSFRSGTSLRPRRNDMLHGIVRGVLGGVAGLALGIAGAEVLAHLTEWETMISPLVMVVGHRLLGRGRGLLRILPG